LATRIGEEAIEPRVVDYDRNLKKIGLRQYEGEAPKPIRVKKAP
jgi:hypothetical protein